MANPIEMAKMVRNYQKTQKKLKQIKVAGLSKDETVGVLLDGTMALVDVEIEEEGLALSADKLAQNFLEAYKAARKELEKQLRQQTSTDELKEMFGM